MLLLESVFASVLTNSISLNKPVCPNAEMVSELILMNNVMMGIELMEMDVLKFVKNKINKIILLH